MQKESQRHNDKGQAKTSLKKYTSHFICNIWQGLLKVCVWEGAGDRTEQQYIYPTLMAVSVVFFVLQGCSTGGPGAHSAGFLYHILSATSLDPTHQGPQGPGVAFPTTSRLLLQLSDFLSWLSYIIVQRRLNLWNGMFDRHQVEITVMQFRGHSLPCISLWVYHGIFYLVPFRQPISTYAISFDYWPLGCVTSFRYITLQWHVWPGRRSKYNNHQSHYYIDFWTYTLGKGMSPLIPSIMG